MKDFTLTIRRQHTEFYTLLGCFVVANLLNAYAIGTHNAPWSELYTSLGYVLVCTLVLYALSVIVRLLAAAAMSLLRKKR